MLSIDASGSREKTLRLNIVPGASIAKVMLVDDDEDLRLIGKAALCDIGGWCTVLAEGGEQAVRLAAAERPDIILLDAMMPRVDGPATLGRLRQHEATATIPVIFMTARARPEDIERYLELGAIGVIRKPFDPLRLAAEVRRILAEAGGRA